MIRIVGVVVVLLALAAGIGYYRGWFHAQTGETGDQRTLQMSVDKAKFEQDKATAEQKVRNLEQK